jgi:hypothetical protein
MLLTKFHIIWPSGFRGKAVLEIKQPFDVLKNPNTVKFYDLFNNVNYDVKVKIAKFCKIILSVVN